MQASPGRVSGIRPRMHSQGQAGAPVRGRDSGGRGGDTELAWDIGRSVLSDACQLPALQSMFAFVGTSTAPEMGPFF